MVRLQKRPCRTNKRHRRVSERYRKSFCEFFSVGRYAIRKTRVEFYDKIFILIFRENALTYKLLTMKLFSEWEGDANIVCRVGPFNTPSIYLFIFDFFTFFPFILSIGITELF